MQLAENEGFLFFIFETVLPLLGFFFFLWASRIFEIRKSPDVVPPLSRINARILSNLGLSYYAENIVPIQSITYFFTAILAARVFLFSLI